MKAVLFRLHPEIHKALRLTAIDAGTSMNELVNNIIEEWLRKRGPREVLIRLPGGVKVKIDSKTLGKGVKK